MRNAGKRVAYCVVQSNDFIAYVDAKWRAEGRLKCERYGKKSKVRRGDSHRCPYNQSVMLLGQFSVVGWSILVQSMARLQ